MISSYVDKFGFSIVETTRYTISSANSLPNVFKYDFLYVKPKNQEWHTKSVIRVDFELIKLKYVNFKEFMDLVSLTEDELNALFYKYYNLLVFK